MTAFKAVINDDCGTTVVQLSSHSFNTVPVVTQQ